ncbi:glycosyltransferase family 2 protein [Sunxiuqinia dokdonensis]|uniref:Glycosyl transferase family 2 n=1 Tax=Sunxiuqinia dokdonensis TaxID=1409788 RepID=A0A0L8VEN7_9BACT|nr:glycosyltransferase family 2 protein [Sunxiuqinia dokdonensis]KOH46926.1 glycosyl transferase family 2 [Sunxiuqinia dokdonensis]
MNVDFKIAVLLTCHNRREKTLLCLKALFQARLKPNYKADVFLVDDGSTDRTGEAVKENFPKIHVIQGDGSLFWNQGMRLAWDTASRNGNYDFYLWLNDDTILDESALEELLNCYQKAFHKDQRPSIIVGACESDAQNNDFTYGGRNEEGAVLPNGDLQICKYMNGNAVLVPQAVFEKLGNLSPEYTHGMGDFDYGLRAQNDGFVCYTTRKYIAVCPRNEGVGAWCNSQTPISKRWELLYSPKGLNLKEYNIFRRKFWGWRWIIYAIKAYLKILFPLFYSSLKVSKK